MLPTISSIHSYLRRRSADCCTSSTKITQQTEEPFVTIFIMGEMSLTLGRATILQGEVHLNLFLQDRF